MPDYSLPNAIRGVEYELSQIRKDGLNLSINVEFPDGALDLGDEEKAALLGIDDKLREVISALRSLADIAAGAMVIEPPERKGAVKTILYAICLFGLGALFAWALVSL